MVQIRNLSTAIQQSLFEIERLLQETRVAVEDAEKIVEMTFSYLNSVSLSKGLCYNLTTYYF